MRKFTVTFEVNDDEFANLMERIARRGEAMEGVDAPAAEVTEVAEETPVAAFETDKRGVVWSAEHHASSKALNADGSWRRKRGGDAAAADAYEAQFTGEPAAPAPAPTAAPAAVATPVVGVPGFPGMNPIPAPVAAEAPAPVSYDDLVSFLNGVVSSGEVKPEELAGVYTKIGLTDPSALATDESLRRRIIDTVKTDFDL